VSAKQNRAELAALKAKLGTGYVPVDIQWWIDGVREAIDARRAGRPYSMVPREHKPLGPAAQRMMKRYDAMAEALKKEGAKVFE
jgi:hypothetical protein